MSTTAIPDCAGARPAEREAFAAAPGSGTPEAEPRTACNGSSGLVGAGGVRPFYDAAGVTIYKGNALAVLMQLPDESVDAVITDPPYSSGGLYRGDRAGSTTKKYVQSGQVTQHGDFAGDNRDQRAYLQWCALWLAECLRVTKPGGVCALFTDWRQLPTTTDALQAGGWVWRGVGAWDKTEAARPMKGRYRNQCEYLVWGSRGGMTEEGPCLPGYWRVTVGGSEKHHIAGKPEKLMQMLVEICKPGGVVLDCFCGSGTTLKAAKETGRRAIGIEIADQWCEVAANRCRQDVLFSSGGGGAEPGERNGAQRSGACSPNDLKLSDRRGWRDRCVAGGKAAVEAAGVTAAPVRCSAWLGDVGVIVFECYRLGRGGGIEGD